MLLSGKKLTDDSPVGIYLLKVKNRNPRTRGETCSTAPIASL